MENVKIIEEWIKIKNAGFSSGTGAGSGNGYGYGYMKSYGSKRIWYIDKIGTHISSVKGDIAKGFVLNNDFTTSPCFIAKGQGHFAHGKSVKEAVKSLHEKILANMDTDEAIAEFIKVFEKGKSYPGEEFFKWHNYLTGSCLMGRNKFVKDKEINLEDKFTVEEFIQLCENDYGHEVIAQLKEEWQKF